MANTNLSAAKNAKNDEFYTQFNDIQKEVNAYTEYNPDVFRGKTVICPCDDPEWSNFTKFFAQNFDFFGLKKLISTSYAYDSKNPKPDFDWQPTLFETENPNYDALKSPKHGKIFTLTDQEEPPRDINKLQWRYLEGDGDFRSREVTELLKEADIVVTNPPFSLFREYIAQLIHFGKKFLILGNKNLITKKEIFPLFQENKVWIGVTPMSRDLLFELPRELADEFVATGKAGSKYKAVGGRIFGRSPSIWYTNLDHRKRHEELILFRSYSPEAYPHYCNYDAIEVSKTEDIPCDWDGLMGVPITFMDKYNPDQFEILGVSSELARATPEIKSWYLAQPEQGHVRTGSDAFYYWRTPTELVRTYDRIVIRRRKAT